MYLAVQGGLGHLIVFSKHLSFKIGEIFQVMRTKPINLSLAVQPYTAWWKLLPLYLVMLFLFLFFWFTMVGMNSWHTCWALWKWCLSFCYSTGKRDSAFCWYRSKPNNNRWYWKHGDVCWAKCRPHQGNFTCSWSGKEACWRGSTPHPSKI